MSDETGAASAAGSSPAPPAESATPAATPASATATPAPAAPTAPDLSATQTGEPPKERWPDILTNARKKEREAAEQEYRQKYGKYDQFETDPWGAIQSWLDQAAGHTLYGPHVTNWAAKTLAARRGQTATVAEEPPPDVPIMDAQGNVTGQTYSAAQLKKWREWDWQQREAQLNQRLQPLEQFREQQAQRETMAQAQAEAVSWGQQKLTTLRQNPYFAKHEARIKQVLIEHEEFGDNVDAAFAHVLTAEVLPALSQTEQQKVLDSLQTKAAAGTVNPGASVAAQRPKFRTDEEALRYYDAHPEEAKAMAER